MKLMIFVFACFAHAWALETPKVNPKNCHVSITTTYKTGEVKSNTRHFKMKNKNECEKMNRILSDNMNPKEIAAVETKFEWRGK